MTTSLTHNPQKRLSQIRNLRMIFFKILDDEFDDWLKDAVKQLLEETSSTAYTSFPDWAEQSLYALLDGKEKLPPITCPRKTSNHN